MQLLKNENILCGVFLAAGDMGVFDISGASGDLV